MIDAKQKPLITQSGLKTHARLQLPRPKITILKSRTVSLEIESVGNCARPWVFSPPENAQSSGQGFSVQHEQAAPGFFGLRLVVDA